MVQMVHNQSCLILKVQMLISQKCLTQMVQTVHNQ